jgi:hypothetical protein
VNLRIEIIWKKGDKMKEIEFVNLYSEMQIKKHCTS